MQYQKKEIRMGGSIIFVVGTRPDALKLVPVYKKLHQLGVPCLLYATYQHRDLLDDVLNFFDVVPSHTVQIMQDSQTLVHIASAVLNASFDYFSSCKPSMVVVQGDTSSSFAAALAAFYLEIPVAHVEAGLRTGDIQAPFPEEANRRFITTISSLHFAPTATNMLNLLRDGVDQRSIFCVGNTIVDTLFSIKQKIDCGELPLSPSTQKIITRCRQEGKKLVLFTMHRRESCEQGVARILDAVIKSARQHPNIIFFFATHPNPKIQKLIALSEIQKIPTIVCSTPIIYHDLVGVLSSAAFVITDSGGIQEEATALGKKVLVLREKTERVEAVWEDMAILVGTNEKALMHGIETLCNQTSFAQKNFIYGDGSASDRIAKILVHYGYFSPQHTSPSHLHPVQSVHAPIRM
jgi:UDP-N-acetylglucosamine 2-epimerase (non-hydrolysing)